MPNRQRIVPVWLEMNQATAVQSCFEVAVGWESDLVVLVAEKHWVEAYLFEIRFEQLAVSIPPDIAGIAVVPADTAVCTVLAFAAVPEGLIVGTFDIAAVGRESISFVVRELIDTAAVGLGCFAAAVLLVAVGDMFVGSFVADIAAVFAVAAEGSFADIVDIVFAGRESFGIAGVAETVVEAVGVAVAVEGCSAADTAASSAAVPESCFALKRYRF